MQPPYEIKSARTKTWITWSYPKRLKLRIIETDSVLVPDNVLYSLQAKLRKQTWITVGYFTYDQAIKMMHQVLEDKEEGNIDG